MPALQWSEAPALDIPLMDDTRREFVELMAVVDATVAMPGALPASIFYGCVGAGCSDSNVFEATAEAA